MLFVARCQGSDLVSVGRLVAIGDQAFGARVVSKLDSVGAVCGHAVVHEQKRAEHTALGGAGVEGQGGGCLGSAPQEAPDPITEGGVKSQVSEHGDELGGHMVLNAEL